MGLIIFVNIGPELARNITNNYGQSNVHEYMKESNINYMYSNGGPLYIPKPYWYVTPLVRSTISPKPQ